MTATEWLPEPNSISLPSIVSSTDLFDGDLFGDELIDIYNAAVDESSSTLPSHEIPTLLPQAANGESVKKPEEVGSDGYAVGVSVDDGLGAFRPSTSFNDLTTLLPPSATSAEGDPAAVGVAVPNQKENSPTTNVQRKRIAVNLPVGAPPAKRSSPSPKNIKSTPTMAQQNGPVGTKKFSGKVSSEHLKTKDGKKNDTPNPLVLGKKVEQVHLSVKPIANRVPPHAAMMAPVVVSPHTSTQVKKDVLLADVSSVVSATAVVPVPTLSITSSAGTPASHTATEADFKSVAQAAVSSLIMNAGSSAKVDSDDGGKKVDTSTAHIKALTGNNWVAACSSTGGGNVTSSAVAEVKANNRARRQNLTPDERARQNRDRNREHARNTRLRKKAYVEELKRTLTELVSQRDAAEVQKRQSAQREVEQREVRFRVIEEFLKLRGRNEPNFARWAAILEDGFSLTLPITGFRKMVNIESKHEGIILEQVLTGVSEVMADSSSFSSFLQSFGNNSEIAHVSFLYNCDRKNFFMDGSNAVLDWTASSVGAIKQGAKAELSLRGTLRAKFSPASNKLLSASVTFDTGLVLSQLHQLIAPKRGAHAESCDEITMAADAAQAASSQADAILDSLQMPHLDSAVPPVATVVPPSATASVTSSEKGENSSDESDGASLTHVQQQT